MTKLQAVNTVLNLIGHGQVAALDTNNGSMAGLAEQLIDQENREVQTRGWHFNTRRKVELSPDGSGNINVTQYALGTMLSLDAEDDEHLDVTVLNQDLYDKTNNTDVFTRNVKVRYTLLMDFNDVPEAVQRLIAHDAALQLLRRRMPRTPSQDHRDLRNQITADRARAAAAAYREDNRARDTNLLETNDAIAMRGRRQGTYYSNPFL